MPLYANTVHEFGHVLFHELPELDRKLAQAIEPTQEALKRDFLLKPTLDDTRILGRIEQILRGFAQETFSDLLATLVMGPAFFLSFYETAWPSDPLAWTAELTDAVGDISAHPSPAHRLAMIWKTGRVEAFVREAVDGLTGEESEAIRRVIRAFEIPDHSVGRERFLVVPEEDVDVDRITGALSRHLSDVGQAMDQFATEAEVILRATCPQVIVRVNAGEVCSLIERLSNDIIPNIISDETLLGRPAGVAEILAAAAAYRLHFLTTRARPMPAKDAEELDKIERLTAKALESTFIQSKYNSAKRT